MTNSFLTVLRMNWGWTVGEAYSKYLHWQIENRPTVTVEVSALRFSDLSYGTSREVDREWNRFANAVCPPGGSSRILPEPSFVFELHGGLSRPSRGPSFLFDIAIRSPGSRQDTN